MKRKKKKKGRDWAMGSGSDSDTNEYGVVHLPDKVQHDKVDLSVLSNQRVGLDD